MTVSHATRGTFPRKLNTCSAGRPQPPAFLGSWSWREPAPGETLRAWTARRARQMDELIARSLPWRQIGQKVQIRHAPHLGPGCDGMYGSIAALGGETFPDYVFVRLEGDDRPHMIGLESLDPCS